MANQAKLFCSVECADEAKFVRYVRRCTRDGRIERPDVLDAIRIRFAMIVGGGYPERERHMPPSIRRAVIARDGGRCQQCGQPGADIDHIEGSSNEIENLQLLCRRCHNKKTIAGLVEIGPGDEDYEETMERAKRLSSRIEASVPKRPCDDDRHWDTRYRRSMLEREKALKKKNAQEKRAAK